MEKIIELKNISKHYYIGKERLEVLKNINLTVENGDFLAITGESGSGKSTLMNILGFLDTPDAGSYAFDGKNSKAFSSHTLSKLRGSKIGFIFQSFHLLPNLTAYQNVELPLIYNKIPKSKRKELCLNALNKVGLTERINHKPNQLSGGQKQRVAIARAIALSPPLILADEPTGNLDPASGKDVLNILENLNKEGTTIIIITHDISIAKKAENQINIINGKIYC
ncbi:MAG: ABC transporter ATP-binding protein [Ruminococcaceae bacterium]|nr:ABC transporter ATP-binding protein [Oscillospiraceae bacterium]